MNVELSKLAHRLYRERFGAKRLTTASPSHRAAIHEAAHAVAMLEYGPHAPLWATIVPTVGFAGHVQGYDRKRWHKGLRRGLCEAVVLLAGPLAERRAGYETHINSDNDGSDIPCAVRSLGTMKHGEIAAEGAVRRATELIYQRRDEIKALADMLMDEGTLFYDEIVAVVEVAKALPLPEPTIIVVP